MLILKEEKTYRMKSFNENLVFANKRKGKNKIKKEAFCKNH